jgi:hypothetical protein
MIIHDYLVVGSGCSGSMAAQTLVEKGLKVTMLDAGIEKSPEAAAIPNEDFLTLRKTDADQYKYLIGENASGVSWGKVGKGEQITPPRQHIFKDVDKYIPVDSKVFSTLESLGYGGLGIGWGLQCWEFSKADLLSAGLHPNRMAEAYQTISDRIGLSATNDDTARYTVGNLKRYHASPAMDRNHEYIMSRYTAKKQQLNEKGFYLGRTPLALITKDMGNRKKYAYRDMDFYSDNDQSAWRPWITINQLKKKTNFQYIGGYLVKSFREKEDYIEASCLQLADGSSVTIRCRKLILATSALGSGRVVLRSLGQEGSSLPFLCSPYTYIPCVQPRFMGKAAEPRKLGFAQLSLFHDEAQTNAAASVASLYSYQSLMMFRIIRNVPLDFADARVWLQYLLSSMVIMGIHHPDMTSQQKFIQLNKSSKTATGDILKIGYSLSAAEISKNNSREKDFIAAMRKMGTYSLKRVDPGHGASIHYAGTLPYSDTDKPFTLATNGRLHGTKNVYVADSSGFNYLPAPGLTFSLMANAHIVAKGIADNVA